MTHPNNAQYQATHRDRHKAYVASLEAKLRDAQAKLAAVENATAQIEELRAQIKELDEKCRAAIAPPSNVDPAKGPVVCSFCDKSNAEVAQMVSGHHGAFICRECVDLCDELLRKNAAERAAAEAEPVLRKKMTEAEYDAERQHIGESPKKKRSKKPEALDWIDCGGAGDNLPEPTYSATAPHGIYWVTPYYGRSMKYAGYRARFSPQGCKTGDDVEIAFAKTPAKAKALALKHYRNNLT